MEPFVAILAKTPEIAHVHGVNSRDIPYSVGLGEAVKEIWTKMHGNKLEEGVVFDVNTEEVIADDQLELLEKYAEGVEPEWGGMKKWVEANRLILLWYFAAAKHWAIVVVDMRECKMVLWDSNAHLFTPELMELRRMEFRPLGRILPQVLKNIGYYDHNPGPHKFTEWPLEFPQPKKMNKLLQSDSSSCGPLALKSMINRLTSKKDTSMNPKQIVTWRTDIAEAIYKFSTEFVPEK